MNLVRERAEAGMPIYGTCTGMILLAKEIVGSQRDRIGLMDITVERNAFGRQVDSFEANLPVQGIDGDPVRAIFIRAPLVTKVGAGVQVLCQFEDKIVMVRQKNLLASSFHPELTDDIRVHQYFLEMISGGK
jgi:5'-phosphate synthase pdxT subunit